MSASPPEIVIAVSACLLGERVRWDGGEKRSPGVEALSAEARLVPVCPEVEAGLGAPREPVVLVRANGLRLRGRERGADHTEAMLRWARERLAELAGTIAGYVLKSRSPSCGAQGVPVHDPAGAPIGAGPGLFAAALRARLPDLPVVEEADLVDPDGRRRFLDQARAYHVLKFQR